ncbi:MAG: endonuclease NucS domain-containing protein [Parvularculales bacterium]
MTMPVVSMDERCYASNWTMPKNYGQTIFNYTEYLMFKRGAKYTRKEIATIARPENPPQGGNWDTGYDRIGDNLFVFMNIDVPGRTGHDFDNHYDPKTQTLIWFGKPNSHSEQPLFQQLITGVLKPLFFARWNTRDPFTFLGTGAIISFQDSVHTVQGHTCIKIALTVQDLRDILSSNLQSLTEVTQETIEYGQSSFLFEKHLEDFIINNWRQLPIGNQYEIYQKDGQLVGQQFRTSTGPIDILGLNKDKSDFLVLELKRDMASDIVVGQTLRYMGWVQENLCSDSQKVNGCIIAHKKDQKLDYALKNVPNIRFFKYEVDFRLVE